jgi:hypothetical protein
VVGKNPRPRFTQQTWGTRHSPCAFATTEWIGIRGAPRYQWQPKKRRRAAALHMETGEYEGLVWGGPDGMISVFLQ